MSRGSFLASEVGLVLLSLVLAAMVWALVRETVSAVKTQLVSVRPVPPPGCGAAVYGPVELQLGGTRGEVESALDRLRERGDTVLLDIAPLPDLVPQRVLGNEDRYRLPFGERLLVSTPPAPRGEVWRLEMHKPVRVAKPELAGAAPPDVRVIVAVEGSPIEVTAPYRAVGDEITPDPIDVAPLLGAGGQPLAAPRRVPLTFERWRRGEGSAAAPDDLLRRRATVVLPAVEASVRFEVTASASLANALEVVVKRGFDVLDITPPPGNNGFTGLRGGDPAGGRLEATFTGRITSTQEVLKYLEEHRDEWRWILVVGEGDLPMAAQAATDVTARLHLTIWSDRFRNALAEGTIAFEPLSVGVQVVRAR